MDPKVIIEVFQAPCCNPRQSAALMAMLADMKKEMGETLDVIIYNISKSDQESWVALGTLAKYMKGKNLNMYLNSGLIGVASALPSIAINGQLAFIKELPERQMMRDAISKT